jgi:hypothetical protein
MQFDRRLKQALDSETDIFDVIWNSWLVMLSLHSCMYTSQRLGLPNVDDILGIKIFKLDLSIDTTFDPTHFSFDKTLMASFS